jgi:Transposase IS4
MSNQEGEVLTERERELLEAAAEEAGIAILPRLAPALPSPRESPPPNESTRNALMREELLASPAEDGRLTTTNSPSFPVGFRTAAGSPLQTEQIHLATQAAINTLNGTPAAANSNSNSQPNSGDSRGKRKASPVTTARKQKKKKGNTEETRIKVGGRVKIQKKNLYHLLESDSQKECLEGFNQNYNCYGTIKSGNAQNGYRVVFDMFPADRKEVFVKRKKLVTVKAGSEEVLYDKKTDDPEELERIEKEKKDKRSPKQISVDEFCSLEDDILANAKTFDYQFTDNPADKVTWKIFGDQEYVREEDDPMDTYTEEAVFKTEINFGSDDSFEDLSKLFFEHFFPDVKGHAKLLDEFHSDSRSPLFTTVKNDKIQFHDPNNEDPDWIVKQAYLLMLAAATEGDVGVENLWKRGSTGGRRSYADFGQYMPKNWFLAFQCAAPYAFAPKQYWFQDRNEKPWDIFMPALDNFNDKRTKLLKVICLVLDESMSGWRPKTSKRGGLPNITFEPRKPVPLGTMLRNACECVTGVLINQDVQMDAEVQARKKYYFSDPVSQTRELTSLPDRSEVPIHTAEVLRQVERSKVIEGGWVGGDAWFGSVATSVEVFKRMGVHSSFVVKNNMDFFPMKPLHSILKARHADRPAGHWVTMTATISEVPLIALAYAWSQKGVSYFISTCGSTEISPIKYESKFEDAWGNTCTKSINRPKLAHFLYEYLPLIDEHNKQRQNILALERCWLTKDVWYRNITTLLGQSAVDMHRCFRNRMLQNGMSAAKVDSIRVTKFVDLVCGGLKQWPKPKQHAQFSNDDATTDERLARIIGPSGDINKAATAKQKEDGRTIGNAYVRNCYVCRGYLNKKGTQINKQTSFWCTKCRMPLCRADRRNEEVFGPEGSRELTCVDAHYYAPDNSIIACNKPHRNGLAFPPESAINFHPRRSARN